MMQLNYISRVLPSSQLMIKRQFWGWLNAVANKVDDERIKEVGPDRAAAEWLLRCGGKVRWNTSPVGTFTSDYNALPSAKHLKIAEIDGTESTIMSDGFPYLKGLKHLEKIVIKRNPYLDDMAIPMFSNVSETLRHLELISIANLTDKGVKSLGALEHLKTLVLFDLPSVRKRQECFEELQKRLPGCDVDWPEVPANRKDEDKKK